MAVKRYGGNFIDPPATGNGRESSDGGSAGGQGGDMWGGIGKFFGDVGNNISNAFQNSNPAFRQQRANTYNGNKQAIAGGGAGNGRDVSGPYPIQHPAQPSNPSFNPNGTRQGADDIEQSTYRDGSAPMTLQEQLLAHMQQQYKRPDASQFDFSAIDNALKGRTDLIENLKNQARGNFDKSDTAIDNMHQAFQREVQTKGADNYNQIADTQKANLAADTQGGISSIQGAAAKTAADREAMLQRLGIQAAGGAVDPSATTSANAVTQLTQHGTADQTMADKNRANNLAQNTNVAQSIGMDGVQRRSALANQLQALMGKADLSENDAATSAANQKASMLNDAQGVAYKAFQDDQTRTKDLFDTLTRDATQNRRYDMQYGPGSKNQSGSQGGGGYAGIAQDLSNTGVSPEDSTAGMQALQDVLSSGNYLSGIQDPNVDKTAVLAQRIAQITHNNGVAAQIASNYGKTSTLR